MVFMVLGRNGGQNKAPQFDSWYIFSELYTLFEMVLKCSTVPLLKARICVNKIRPAARGHLWNLV